MIYRGRYLDPVALWSDFVDFPTNMPDSGFAPLVKCPNPDHHTEKRHFQLNLDLPLCHCFSNCGISGTYEKAIALIRGTDEREARRYIKRYTRAALDPASKRKHGPNSRNRRKVRGLDENSMATPSLEFDRYIPHVGLEYLAERGIDASSASAAELGWDGNELRIVIPAKDIRGVTRFLIKRAVKPKDWPKYLYWPEKEVCGWGKTDLLFGACNLDLKLIESQGLILCEGSLDCIRLYQNGALNASAILGSKLSERQAEIIRRLRPKRIFCMFDKDAAGVRNIFSVEEKIKSCPIFVTLYPKEKSDPAELSRKEVERAIEKAIPLVMFRKRIRNRKLPETRKVVANA